MVNRLLFSNDCGKVFYKNIDTILFVITAVIPYNCIHVHSLTTVSMTFIIVYTPWSLPTEIMNLNKQIILVYIHMYIQLYEVCRFK